MPYLYYTPEELETEEWRDVVGYETYYQISNLGRVRRLGGTTKCRKTRVLKIQPHDGYAYVSLCVNSQIKFVGVHILVAKAFIGPYPEGHEVNHIDHNALNPRLDNLEYVTHKRNTQYAVECGRFNRTNRGKLKAEDIPVIRRLLAEGYFNTTIATLFRVSSDAISEIKRGKNWKHVPL